MVENEFSGAIKWFNMNGYGFIIRNKTCEVIFVFKTVITWNNLQKIMRSVGQGKTVKFDFLFCEKVREAVNVTGPDGELVQSSPCTTDRRRFQSHVINGRCSPGNKDTRDTAETWRPQPTQRWASSSRPFP